MPSHLARCFAAGAALLLAGPLAAQSTYQFGIDQDKLHGAPDFSYLNHPLSAADRVFVKDGHFYIAGPDLIPDTQDDQRIRFFGVNLAFGANFPVGPDAARIAARLRRLGVNMVRLHHMDSSPDPVANPASGNSILTTGPYPSFNDITIANLRGFLTALSSQGIYVDLNLHVGYQFRPATDQIPALSGQSIPNQSKPLHIFFPRMVELQQQFTLGLVDRLKLKGDPVLALVEINNESSLVQAWQGGQLDPVLDGEYRTALTRQWNQWLAARYASTPALAAAWGTSTPDGPDLLPGAWTLEQGHGKTGTLTTVTMDGIRTAQVTPGAGSGWLFLKQTGFHLDNGARYVWRFQAKVDAPAGQTVQVPVSVMRDVSPWDGFLYRNIQLTNQWQTFTVAVTPSFDIHDSGRVSLDVEYAPGNVYVRSMTLVKAGQRGLAPEESVESASVSLIGPGEGATQPRLADYVRFLTATDRAYFSALSEAVHAATDPLTPVTGTQMGYGGLSILDSQAEASYQDNHFYIDHYNFPNTAWDGFDWRIRDAAAADNVWSSLLDMAWARQDGRPYTVSEFNQPWPNTHGAEIDPTLAAFASYQDWDGIMHFAYSHSRGWDANVPNGFNLNGDWTKFAVFGQSAWMFRTGAVQPGAASVAIPVPADERVQATATGQSITAWVVNRGGVPKEAAFTRKVSLAKDSAAVVPASTAPPAPYKTDTGQLTFDRDGKLFTVNAPEAAGIFGAAGTRKVTSGPIDLELAPGARGFASVLLTALDKRPVASSSKLLLSLPGPATRAVPALRNTAPDSQSARPQALVRYPGTTDWWTIDATNSPNSAKPAGDLNGGWPPVFIERVEAWITLRTSAQSISVQALDGSGEPAVQLEPADVVAVPGGFRIHVNSVGSKTSVWFLISAAQRPSVPRTRR